MSHDRYVLMACAAVFMIATLGLVWEVSKPRRYEWVELRGGDMYVIDSDLTWDDCVERVNATRERTYCR